MELRERRLRCRNVPILSVNPFKNLIELDIPLDFDKILKILTQVCQELVGVEGLTLEAIEKSVKLYVERTNAFGVPQDLFYKQIAKYSSLTEDCQSQNLFEKWTKRRDCIFGGSFLDICLHPLPPNKNKYNEDLSPDGVFNIIKNLKKHCLPIRTLNEGKVIEFVYAMETLVFEEGTPLVKPLQWQDTFYYIERGIIGRFDFNAENPNKPDKIFQEGQCFGEENLFFANVSNFTLRCLSECVLRITDRVTFKNIAMKNVAERHTSLDNILSQFPGFSKNQVYRIVNSLETIKLGHGSDVLVSCPGCSLYILEDGIIKALLCDRKNYKFEKVLEKWDVIGINRLFATINLKYVRATIVTDTATISFLRRDALERMFNLPELYKITHKDEGPDDKVSFW